MEYNYKMDLIGREILELFLLFRNIILTKKYVNDDTFDKKRVRDCLLGSSIIGLTN